MTETRRVNELHPELMGLQAINSLAYTNSASRSVMHGSHFTQHLVTSGLEEKILVAGPELELAKYTLGIRMPEDGKIITVIQKYPAGAGQGSLQLNPESLVVYEKASTREIDCFTIPIYRSFHQYFGWQCVPREGLEMLRPGTYIPKDTVFADTPGVKDGNSYMYGRNTNVAYMAIPPVSEDGFAVSRSVLEHWKYRIYEVRTVEWGSTKFPINIYGHNKPFPDIGEYLREDGLLMALRTYDPDTYAVDMGINDMLEIDPLFDQQVYVKPSSHKGPAPGLGGGRVVDIEILSNNNPQKNTPIGMSDHADKYVQALLKYNHEIVALEERLRRERKSKFGNASIQLSPAFHKTLVRALAITNHGADKLRQTLKLLHRKEQIDEYHARFVIEYEFKPGIGDKFSNSSGSKGVICKILEDHEMPIRPDGVRADIIIDPGPVFHRMNIGQSYEQYMTCAAYDVTVRIAEKLGIIASKHATDFDNRPEIAVEEMLEVNQDIFDQCYDYLMTFYRVFNDKQPDFFSALSREDQAEHLCDVINEGTCRIFLPVNNEKLPDEIVEELEAKFQPTMTPVKYVDASGNQVETVNDVRIGKVYMFLLDKLAAEWSATSVARLQHFGILSSVTKSEKFAFPYRNSPTRLSGETESRIFACYTGAEAIAEMFDRTNNPITRRNVYWKLLENDNPSQIDEIVNRDEIPLGASRPIQIVNHIFMCAGFKPEYFPEAVGAMHS